MERRKASKEAADLVLKIWDRRAVLPGSSNPLARYNEAVNVLNALGQAYRPWPSRTTNRWGTVAATLYRRMSEAIQLMCSDVLPTSRRKVPSLVIRRLSPKERLLLKRLEGWLDDSPAAAKNIGAKKRKTVGAAEIKKLLIALLDDTIKQLRGFRRELVAPTDGPEEMSPSDGEP